MAKTKQNGSAVNGNGKWADDLTDWKAAALMPVTLPSGRKIVMRAVTLDELFAEGAVPDHLIQVALLNMKQDGVVRQLAAHYSAGEPEKAESVSRSNLELRDRLVLRAVVEPAITEADLPALDIYDKAMIAELCQRTLDRDATGKKVGADSLDSFRAGAAQLATSEADEGRKRVLLELAGLQ